MKKISKLLIVINIILLMVNFGTFLNNYNLNKDIEKMQNRYYSKFIDASKELNEFLKSDEVKTDNSNNEYIYRLLRVEETYKAYQLFTFLNNYNETEQFKDISYLFNDLWNVIAIGDISERSSDEIKTMSDNISELINQFSLYIDY
ncbi:hypothetical protein [Chengkuizengella sediminis]|uniref:hypothetical protein n=1 Tax=Chengkuizengella sediminis TaxID=1885917 RepID=UPI0013898634|nr:hypothetical protein [Chengkuizengella sediminis]NDI34538.1 hypothetical protein [Chengkuizengella sediminis]